jgi:NAD(P)-dependent dehydrogenase (short-subunit alcohol dehydrogenase family)
MSIYGSTKGALDSLMRCLAIELAPKVRVNSVLPGGVKTEMTASIYENKELIDRMEATYPLGFGYPEDIYEAVNFLLSDKSRWITGQQFTVDGGRTINITG